MLPGVRVSLRARRREWARSKGVGRDLQRRRTALGQTQREVAARIGVAPTTYRDWEEGRKNPDAPYYPAIIAFLGVEPWPQPRTLAERLKAERLRRGLGRRAMARLLGIPEMTVHRTETGKPTTIDRAELALAALLAGDRHE